MGEVHLLNTVLDEPGSQEMNVQNEGAYILIQLSMIAIMDPDNPVSMTSVFVFFRQNGKMDRKLNSNQRVALNAQKLAV